MKRKTESEIIAGNKINGWMRTFTGKHFRPLQPKAADVNIDDIAHALSHICRFGGHTPAFYSVAQHCVEVSWLAPESLALVGLMHDAPEAYVGDLILPIKRQLPVWEHIETPVWCAICGKFNMLPESIAHIKPADTVALLMEVRDLFGSEALADMPKEYENIELPARGLEPWSPRRARSEFLYRFSNLTGWE